MIVDILWTIFYTMLYTLASVFMSFKLAEMLNNQDEISLDIFVRHFLVWPIECLFLLIFFVRYRLGYDQKKKNHK